MNLIKVAAIATLVVTLIAGGDLDYELTAVKSEQEKAAYICTMCKLERDTAAMKWEVDKEKVRAAELAGGELARLAAEQAYAGDRPVILGPCPGCDFPPPDYETPTVVAIIGLVMSMVLFGVAKHAS
jgi:hypothetical protein